MVNIRPVINKPKIVVFCGSSKFTQLMAVAMWLVERDEQAITLGLHLLPNWYPNVPESHLAEAEGVADQMDELHLRKIDLCDEVFVINYDHYIGDSTRREIEYAQKLNKPIRWYTHDKIGEQINAML